MPNTEEPEVATGRLIPRTLSFMLRMLVRKGYSIESKRKVFVKSS